MANEEDELVLGDLVSLTRGTTYQSALLGQPGPVLLGLASIKRNGGFRDDNLKTYGGECPAKLTLRPGDIFVSLKDVTQAAELLGAIARVPPHIPAGRVTQDTVKLTFTRDDIPSRYVYWLLRTPAYREYCRAHAIGTTNLALPREDFLAFPIPRPKEREMSLVDILDALDDKIELNRRMNATLEAMARALFQSWFVDFDPVRAKLDGQGFNSPSLDAATAALFPDSFQDSELGHIPKGWKISRIQDQVEEVFDGPHATPPDSDEGPVFLGIKNLTGSSLDLTDIKHISESDWPRWTRRVTPRHLDIVFSYEATLGFFALVPPGLRCCLGRRLALVRPKPNGGHPHFWFHQFIGPDFQRYLIQHSVQGATVDRIPLIHFPKYQVLNPPNQLKEAFDQRVAPLWAKVHANQEQSRTLAALRDMLLPKLLSGELSVAEATHQTH